MSNLADSQAAPDSQDPPEPYGVAGWLVLPVAGFAISMLQTAANLLEAILDREGLRGEILNATSGPLVALQVPMALSFLGGCLIVVIAGYCLYLIFFTNKRAIVNFATALYLIGASGGLIDLWLEMTAETAIPDTPPDSAIIEVMMVKNILLACIWIPYFHLSRRVKNTYMK